MYSKFLLLLTTLVLAGTLWTSCDDPQTCDCGDPGPELGSIQIVTGAFNDTLVFLPNDSASTTVTVIVTDTRGQAYPGVQVDISLSDPSLGVLEFVDPILQDTTNLYGRVNLVFRVFNESGDQVITATALGQTVQRVLHIRETNPIVSSLLITAIPDELPAYTSEEVYSVITIRLVDESNRGIPNAAVQVHATGGVHPWPSLTDSSGSTSFHWTFQNTYGSFWMTAVYGAIRDSVRVDVTHREEPYIGPYVLTTDFPVDTLWIEPESEHTIHFRIHVEDTLGFVLPGVKVNFSLTNPGFGQLEFYDPNLRDTTDHNGDVRLAFRSLGQDGDQTISACVGEDCLFINFSLILVYEPPQVNIYTIPATLRVDSNTVGEAIIRIVALDDHGILLPGITPTLSVEAGEFDPPPPTNSNGESETTWRFFNEYGAFGVTATIEYNNQTATDSAMINVLYGP